MSGAIGRKAIGWLNLRICLGLTLLAVGVIRARIYGTDLTAVAWILGGCAVLAPRLALELLWVTLKGAGKQLAQASRFAWRHRHVIPYVDGALTALGALSAFIALTAIIGPGRALIIVGTPGLIVWFLRDRLLLRFHWAGAIKETEQLGRVPIRRLKHIPVGSRLKVRLPPGQTAEQLDKFSANIASYLDGKRRASVRSVRVLPDPGNANRAVVYIAERDPLGDLAGTELRWPWLDAETTSVWDPIPLGKDANGDEVTLKLFEPGTGARSLLAGGLPGYGKTSLFDLALSECEKDPTCATFTVDGKPDNLKRHAPRSTMHAGDASIPAEQNAQRIEATLKAAEEWMNRAYARLDGGTVQPGDPTAAVFIDEIQEILPGGKNDPIEKRVASLAKRGRQAGLAVAVATQKSTADACPTKIRSVIHHRLAFTTRDSETSKAILGHSDPDARDLPKQAGRCYFDDGSSGTVTEIVTYYVSPDDARKVVAQTAHLRIEEGTTQPTQGEADRSAGASPAVTAAPESAAGVSALVPRQDPPEDSEDGSESESESAQRAQEPTVPPAVSESEPSPNASPNPESFDVPGMPPRGDGPADVVPARHRVVPDEMTKSDRAEFALLTMAHLPNTTIAREIGVDEKVVRDARKAMGLPRAKRSA